MARKAAPSQAAKTATKGEGCAKSTSIKIDTKSSGSQPPPRTFRRRGNSLKKSAGMLANRAAGYGLEALELAATAYFLGIQYLAKPIASLMPFTSGSLSEACRSTTSVLCGSA